MRKYFRADLGAPAVDVLDGADAVEAVGFDEERRVGAVEHLVRLGELAVDEAQEVALGGRVQSEAGLVEQEHGPASVLLLDIGKVREEGEEPHEAA